jgi:tetratricopeptide (TPR) repeat protein
MSRRVPSGRSAPFGSLVTWLLVAAFVLSATTADARKKSGEEAEEERVGVNTVVAEKLLEAYELLQADEADRALALVDKLAKRRRLGPPERAQIHRFRGYIYVTKGMPEKAAGEFETALAQKALDRSAAQAMMYSLAQIYTQIGQYDRALAVIDTWFAGEQSPKPDAFYLKAMILVQQENFEAALEPARTAVEQSPAPKESWLQLLVAIYSNLRDFPNVAATLERLIALSPGKGLYWVQLAAVEHFLERDAKAAATMRLADEGELLAKDAEFRQLARLLFLREMPFECARVIEQGISAGQIEADADSYQLLANCYLAAREQDKAIEPLAKAGELAPDAQMYMLLGQLHLQRDRFEPALDALRKALPKAKPEQRGSVQLLMGVAQLGAENLDEAEKSFRAALADESVRRAAESYLKHVEEMRARGDDAKPLQTASTD